MRVSKFYGSIASIGWKSRVLQLLIVSLFAVSMLAGCHHIKKPQPFPPLDVVPVEGIIEPSLATYLDTVDGDEFVPVMLIFKKHVSMDDKIRIFSEIKTNDRMERKRRKRKLLVAELKRVARADQARVAALLRGFEKIGQVQEIRDLWISNIIGIRATKWVIPLLTHFEEIERIHLDLPRPVMGALECGFANQCEWGVNQVNAHLVWPNPPVRPLGYDGSGVIVAVVDSGVDYTHPDLANRQWVNIDEGVGDYNGDNCPGVCGVDDDGDGLIDEDYQGNPGVFVAGAPTNPSFDTAYVDDDDENGYIDDINGWNFENNDNDPMDDTGHGTQVAGIIAGNNAGGTHIGVAPGAIIMPLKITTSGLPEDVMVSMQQQALDSIQYAMDNGANIVNSSNAWLDCYDAVAGGCDTTTCTNVDDLSKSDKCWSPDYKSWRDMVQNTMDTGNVLFVTISGNVGGVASAYPPPYQVLTPGRVPQALTVGATADDTNAIADFSSIGPVTLEEIKDLDGTTVLFDAYPHPPGLTKPDVVAPGVSIPTAQKGGGYVTAPAGTSLAAPHVAGVAALLLQKNPDLSPYELKYLIEETAVDLGAFSPNNEFGWGLVNAQAAINLTNADAFGEKFDRTTPYDLAITPTGATWTSADIFVDDDNDLIPDTGELSRSRSHLLKALVRNLGGQVVTNVELKFYYADVSTVGIGGFDPNNDGDPSDSDDTWTYIGSYTVPTIGPAGSDHDTAAGVVNWDIETPTSDHWCVGVGIVAPAGLNLSEDTKTNNTAFRNFFNIVTSTGALNFRIVPPPKAPTRPFGFEMQAQNVPKGATIELLVDKALEKQLFVNVEGLSKVKHHLLGLKDKDKGHNKALEKHITYVRYRMTGNRAVLRDIVSKKGASIPAKIVVNVPHDAPVDGERLVVLSTLDQKGKRVGGLTINLVKGTPFQKGGPFLPKKVK